MAKRKQKVTPAPDNAAVTDANTSGVPEDVAAEGSRANANSVEALGEGAPVASDPYSPRSVTKLTEQVQSLLEVWGAKVQLSPAKGGSIDRLPPDLWATLLAVQSFVQEFGEGEGQFELTPEAVSNDSGLRVLGSKLIMLQQNKDLRRMANQQAQAAEQQASAQEPAPPASGRSDEDILKEGLA